MCMCVRKRIRERERENERASERNRERNYRALFIVYQCEND